MIRDILITSSVLICAVLLIRALFRKALSRRAQYALWLLVAMRLLLPVNLPALGHSVLTVAQPLQEAAEEVGEQPAGTVRYDTLTIEEFRATHPATFDWEAVAGRNGEENAEIAQPWQDPNVKGDTYAALSRDGDSVNLYQRLTVTDILTRVWYGGMAIMGAWFFLANLLFYFRLCKTRRLLNVPDCKRKVFVTDAIPSPCLFGLLRPAIYLTPKAAEDPAARRYAILHEETHARHGDPLWSLVRGICLVVYWFDPLVWVAATVSKIDCELACDEGVLSTLPDTERIPYGQTLVALIPVKKLGTSPLLSATTMTAGKRQMKDRITRIAQNRKPLLWALGVVLVLAVVICAVTFTGAREGQTEPSKVITTEQQLELLVEHRSEWTVDPSAELGWQAYAVTDLDRDGQIELVAAWYDRNGPHNRFYEVDTEGLTLSAPYELEGNSTVFNIVPFRKTERVPVATGGTARIAKETYPAYIERDDTTETARYWYIFEANIPGRSDNYTSLSMTKQALSLGDNGLEVRLLGFIRDLLSGRFYYNAEDKEIGAAEYLTLADQAFPGQTSTSAGLFWLDSFSPADYDKDRLISHLRCSYEGFTLGDGQPAPLAEPSPEGSLSAGAVPFENIMGLSGYYEDTNSGSSFTIRNYYAYLPDGSAVPVAQHYGDDVNFGQCWVRDLDGDGITELICNNVTGGDGHPGVAVYLRAGNAILQGELNSYNLGITDWNNWGLNSFETRYDPDREVFVFRYADAETEGAFKERTTASLRDFYFEEYADLWPTVDLFAVEGDEVTVYQELLRQFIVYPEEYKRVRTPGGDILLLLEGNLSDNQFAICDIDGDGQQELLFQYTTTAVAGMEEYVFRYDPATGQVELQGSFFPGVTYFDNGCLKERASHNQSSSPVWPYNLYRYDANRDSYGVVASVFGRNMDGGPFNEVTDGPAYSDAPWYAVSTPAGQIAPGQYPDEWDHEIMTGVEYTRWTEGVFRNARELLPPWQDLTLENIDGYPLRSAPLSAGNTAPSFSRDGVSFHRYYGDGWHMDVPDRWGEDLHSMIWTAPTNTASITVNHGAPNVRNMKAYYAEMGSWPYETDMPAPFDLYYDFGAHDPTWGIKYELYFVPESDSSSFVLQCAGDWGEAAQEDWDMLHTILQTFTVDGDAHPVATDRYVAGESEMAVVLDALADPNTTVYMGLSRDGYAFGYTDPAWNRSPLSADFAAQLTEFEYTDFVPRGIDPSPQEHQGADDVALVLRDLGCTMTFYKGSSIISLYYQGESFYATASHPDGLTPYEVAYDWYIALAGHPSRSYEGSLERAREALEQDGANEITNTYIGSVNGINDTRITLSKADLELIRSRADYLMEDSEAYSSLGQPIVLMSENGGLHLTLTDVPGLIRVDGDRRAYAFSAVTESPELEALLNANQRLGYEHWNMMMDYLRETVYPDRRVYWLQEPYVPDTPQEGDIGVSWGIVERGRTRVYETEGVAFEVPMSMYTNGRWNQLSPNYYAVLSQGADGTWERVFGLHPVKEDESVEDAILATAWGIDDAEFSLRRDGYPQLMGLGGDFTHGGTALFSGFFNVEGTSTVWENADPIYRAGDKWMWYEWDGFKVLYYHPADGTADSIKQIDTTRTDIATWRGIRVGSTRAEVRTAYPTDLYDHLFFDLYPEDDHPHDDVLVYCRSPLGYGDTLIFFFENDRVSRIVLIDFFD